MGRRDGEPIDDTALWSTACDIDPLDTVTVILPESWADGGLVDADQGRHSFEGVAVSQYESVMARKGAVRIKGVTDAFGDEYDYFRLQFWYHHPGFLLEVRSAEAFHYDSGGDVVSTPIGDVVDLDVGAAVAREEVFDDAN